MSIILPNLNHSFICLVAVPVPVMVPFAGSVCGFRIPDFPYALSQPLQRQTNFESLST